MLVLTPHGTTAYTRSMMIAGAMPPAAHVVIRADLGHGDDPGTRL